MKIKWFGMFGDSIVRDEYGRVDKWKSTKRSWVLTFYDPIGWILMLFIVFLFVMVFFQ